MGATFENLYIRTWQSDALLNAVEETMKKRGYTRISNEDAAELCVSVHVPKTGAWCFVSSDHETPGFLRRMAKPLAELAGAEVLFAACSGSDVLQTALLAPGGENAQVRINVTRPAPPPKDTEAAIWKRVLSDLAAFTQAVTAEYTFAEEFLFSLALLIDLPAENMLFWDADENTVSLCFCKKQSKKNAQKSAAAMLGTALKKEGFQKLPHGFYKPLNGEMGLCVTIEREKQASYTETERGLTHRYGTNKTAYDLRVCVTGEEAVRTGHFLGIEISLIAALPQKQLIVDLIYTAPEVAVILLQAFYDYAFIPLFRNDHPLPSVFDTMCFWELRARGAVDYKSYEKALVAYQENRPQEALICLKWIFYPYFHNDPADWSEYGVRLLRGEEIDTLRGSEYDEQLKNCFSLYDKLRETSPFLID